MWDGSNLEAGMIPIPMQPAEIAWFLLHTALTSKECQYSPCRDPLYTVWLLLHFHLSTVAIAWAAVLAIAFRLAPPYTQTPRSASGFCGALLFAFIRYQLAAAIWNAYLHPLSKFPGPKLNAISKLPREISSLKGQLPHYVAALHKQYGEVVRVAPNELSFISPAAWSDIYGPQPAHAQFQKDPTRYVVEGNIVISYRALRDQEPLLQHHVDLLISKLRQQVDQGLEKGKVDISRWLNWTTFDIVGDLAFGESFECLEKTETHSWVAAIFDGLRVGAFFSVARQFTILKFLLPHLVPLEMIRKRQAHHRLAREKLDRRLARETDRPDFIHHLLRQKTNEEGLTREEFHSNATLLILAGSETTASSLTGTIYQLCRNKEAMRKLCLEIRTAFSSESQITFSSVQGLVYMNAVIEESLRMYPPVPGALPRVVPNPAACIAGYVVPGGTIVNIYQFAANLSSAHFTEPTSFIPERWLKTDPDARYAKDNKNVVRPFSVGPRNCIGKNLAFAEMRLILARLLFNFDIELCAVSEHWADKQRSFVVWEKPPLMVQLRKRQELSAGNAA